MIAISVAATKSYFHAFPQCVRSIAAAAAHLKTAHFIFATDTSEESKNAEEVLKNELPPGWEITTIRLKEMEQDSKDYQPVAQLRISRLQGAAFHFARTKIKPEHFWNVESDNIVPPNALRMLEWTLGMPTEDGGSYYQVAAATYPNELFLGGFGTPQNQIAENFQPHERKVDGRLKLCVEACDKRLEAARLAQPDPGITDDPAALGEWRKDLQARADKEFKRRERLQKRVRNCPPDGNIWEVTAKHGWRRRGWMDFAYPGIGEGAVVPSDWCGLGCTLLSKRALALADFNGYNGRGTQDLFLCWSRWYPAGLKIACVPHVVCDHVKRQGEEIVHYIAYHEQNPEYKGHLRVRSQPWVAA